MSRFVSDRAYEYFDLGDESDQEGAESSDDEIDIILHGTPEQRRHLQRVHKKELRDRRLGRKGQQTNSVSLQQQERDGKESSSEDEFEKEMNAVLDKSISVMEEKSRVKFDGREGDSRVQGHSSGPSNDDLLYDPDMDEVDQQWVNEQRRRHHGDHGNGQAGKDKPKQGKKGGAPRSDAVLDCPACMTTLCIDCQVHDVYPNQFRAMFVMNCKVNSSELLTVPEQAAKKKYKKFKSSKEDRGESEKSNTDQASSSKDQFHPVMCEECSTVVGVIDIDEVYHFFNVLAGQP